MVDSQPTTRPGAGTLAGPRRPPARRDWRPWWRLSPVARAAIVDVVSTFVALKSGFYLLALFATWMLPEYGGDAYPRWYSGAERLIDISWRWDGEWYMSIARDGYALRDGYTNVAFFPLYPLLTRALALALPGGNLPLAGVLVVGAAFLAALFYLHALAMLDGGPALARRAVWYVAIVPTGFFFHAAYSESLFLLTAAATIYHVRREEWWAAGVWGMLATLTRAQGVVLWLPLAWALATVWRRERRLPRRSLGSLALPPLGVGLFMAYLYASFGDPLAFLHVQSEWGRSLGFPPATLWQGLAMVFAGYRDWTYPLETINTVMVALYLLIALASLRRWPAAYTLYVFASLTLALLMPAEGRPVESGARFMAVLFPVAFSVAAWSEKHPALGVLVTAVCLPMFALLAALFVNWYWVV